MPFREVFACYNADPGDDLGLTIAARGPNFTVVGLDVQTGDPDGFCGRVLFPSVAPGGAEELREDFVDAGLNMPRDLNGDGMVDALDHGDDYVLLPVRVRVEWRGISGPRQIELETMLSAR